MPTLIQFSSGDSITVEDDYDRVNSDLHSSAQGGQLKRVDGGNDAWGLGFPPPQPGQS